MLRKRTRPKKYQIPNVLALIAFGLCPLVNGTLFMDEIISKRGSTVLFKCADVAANNDTQSNFLWYHHWDALNADILRNLRPISDRYIIYIRNVQAQDEGYYTCITSNATHTTFVTSWLELEAEPPHFIRPKSLVGKLYKPPGITIMIPCHFTGHPMPNVTLTRNNNERIEPLLNDNQWGIRMADILCNDTGIYKCTVCNALGCIERYTIVVDRLPARPLISKGFPQNQTVLINRSTYMECRVVSDLTPYIDWFKYTQWNESIEKLEKLVPNLSRNQGIHTNDVILLDPNPNKTNIITFNKVSHEDEGWYSCVAATSLGQSVASAYLKVVDDETTVAVGFLPIRPIIIVALGIALIFVLLGLVSLYVMCNLKREKRLNQRIDTIYQWTKKVIIYKPLLPLADNTNLCVLQVPIIKIEKQRLDSNSNRQVCNEYEFPLDSNWEIPRSQLRLGCTLGEGAFGLVVMAQLSANGPDTTTTVAVKMVKTEHNDDDVTSLVHEMEVMKLIGKHCNIINLLGCCSQNGPLWVIVEYAAHGNLKNFLEKNRPLTRYLNDCGSSSSSENKTHLTEKHLISFALQIARGMEYLASRKCIHRDLAARNVLVTENYVMKIADFGLARDIQDTDYYRKITNGLLPIKWMAIESLEERYYNSQSDVWSYGILLWEIMTYGKQPYSNIMSAEDLYRFLVTGQRMEKPSRCSLDIYTLMRQCWHFEAKARPTFSEIVETLEQILQLNGTGTTTTTTNTTTTTTTTTIANIEYVEMTLPHDVDSDNERFQENSLRYQNTSLIIK